MNLVIVTTTINPPTVATLKFCELANINKWLFIIVGDKKTPNHLYRDLESKYKSLIYLDAKEQDHLFPELSKNIGWNKIQRRNIGFVYAWFLGAEILATVDDDNIPYEKWGSVIHVGKEALYDCYEPYSDVFDPLSVTKYKKIWHRGYPIQLLKERLQINYQGQKNKKVLVQADLWDGDPDIDAIARLTYTPTVKYNIQTPYGSEKIAPFNSQNTFLHRSVIPKYAVLPFIGRMDDIWGSYILQTYFPNAVIYHKASVYQARNQQDLVTNLEDEIMGYRNTLDFIKSGDRFEQFLPQETLDFWRCYQRQYKDQTIRRSIKIHFQKRIASNKSIK